MNNCNTYYNTYNLKREKLKEFKRIQYKWEIIYKIQFYTYKM